MGRKLSPWPMSVALTAALWAAIITALRLVFGRHG